MAEDEAERIAVLGAGAWGTTLARMLAAAGHPVTLWAHRPEVAAEMARDGENRRYLPGHVFPPGLVVTADAAELSGPHGLYVLAVPSAHARETLRSVAGELAAGTPFLSVVKGIEAGTQARMSEVIEEEAPGRPVAVLSGPNLAPEIASGLPVGTVVASADPELANEVAGTLGSDRFRVYTNPDVVGVELGGALKNVIALAAGMADGLRMGDSGKAAIITRGLAEITRLGVAAGADPRTFAGLAGVGDLIATCMSQLSRNRRAGELLASNMAWADVAGELGGVAEGESTVTGALALAAQHGVEMPIADQVDAVIHRGRAPLEAVASLMARAQKDELTGRDA
jgi:glycerol-3-phosphate dehydrogenase (NAD(P)+)